MAERSVAPFSFGEMRRIVNEVLPPQFSENQDDFQNQVVRNLREVFNHFDNAGVEITQDGNLMEYLRATFCSAACLTLIKTLAMSVRYLHTDSEQKMHQGILKEIDGKLQTVEGLLVQINGRLSEMEYRLKMITESENSSSRAENENLFRENYELMELHFIKCNKLLCDTKTQLEAGLAQVNRDKKSAVLRGAEAVAGAMIPVGVIAKTMESLVTFIGMPAAIGVASAIAVADVSVFGYIGSQIWKQFQSLSGFQEQYEKEYDRCKELKKELDYIESQCGVVSQTKMVQDLLVIKQTLEEEKNSAQQEAEIYKKAAEDYKKEAEDLKKMLEALQKQQNP